MAILGAISTGIVSERSTVGPDESVIRLSFDILQAYTGPGNLLQHHRSAVIKEPAIVSLKLVACEQPSSSSINLLINVLLDRCLLQIS